MSLLVDIEKELNGFHLRSSFESGDEIVGLLGASGSGKSMTLKCIAGIEKPDKGLIVLDETVLFNSERRINLPPQKRQVGYLFQNYALFPNMTVLQNVLCGLRWERDRKKRDAAAAEALDMLQLTSLAGRRPSQLSGGQAQRVALARILVNRPKLLMLDEPFSALDSYLRLRLEIQLRDVLKGYGRGVLMVTHDRNEVSRMCSRVAVIDDGRLLAMKDTKDFFADPGSVPAAVLSGCKNVAPACRVGEREVEVPDWGVRFTTEAPVRDGLTAVGIRAHYFSADCMENRRRVRFTGEMEEPFEWVLEFRFEGQSPDSEPLWQRLPKDRRPGFLPHALGVAPRDVLLLYDGTGLRE